MFCIWRKRWCCPDRKNSSMFGESGFSKSSPTVYLCTTFWYCNPIKILLATSLVLGKNKGKLQSCSLDLPYREKLKHQWQLYTCMLPKWLPSQNSRVQIANLCHKFQFVILFNLRCLVNFHFSWWSSLEKKKSNERWVEIHRIWKFRKGKTQMNNT